MKAAFSRVGTDRVWACRKCDVFLPRKAGKTGPRNFRSLTSEEKAARSAQAKALWATEEYRQAQHEAATARLLRRLKAR